MIYYTKPAEISTKSVSHRTEKNTKKFQQSKVKSSKNGTSRKVIKINIAVA